MTGRLAVALVLAFLPLPLAIIAVGSFKSNLASPEDPIPTLEDITVNPKSLEIVEPKPAILPRLVYLIPVIALLGIGIPPVVRLTALGIASVPPGVREAATAFGTSRSFLQFDVDLPARTGVTRLRRRPDSRKMV